MLLEEDVFLAQEFLDNNNIPRTDEDGRIYSILKRISLLGYKLYKTRSTLETVYLRAKHSAPELGKMCHETLRETL